MRIKVGMALMLFIAGCIVSPAQSDRQERAALGLVLEAVGKAATRPELKATLRPLEQVREMAPGWAEPWYVFGRIYEVLDVYGQAAEGYEKYLELSAGAPDREEVLGRIRSCRLRQEALERDKRLMAEGTWTKIMHLPPVNFNPPMVSTRFRIGRSGRMEAQHPYLHQVDNPRQDAVKAAWSPVEFDGRFFEYEYRVYFKALDPPRTEYTIETIRGEIIPGSPCRVRQAAYHGASPTLFPDRPGAEELIGEVLHELR